MLIAIINTRYTTQYFRQLLLLSLIQNELRLEEPVLNWKLNSRLQFLIQFIHIWNMLENESSSSSRWGRSLLSSSSFFFSMIHIQQHNKDYTMVLQMVVTMVESWSCLKRFLLLHYIYTLCFSYIYSPVCIYKRPPQLTPHGVRAEWVWGKKFDSYPNIIFYLERSKDHFKSKIKVFHGDHLEIF